MGRRRQRNPTLQKTINSIENLVGNKKKMNTQFLTPTEH
jgi:hypothetical protein